MINMRKLILFTVLIVKFATANSNNDIDIEKRQPIKIIASKAISTTISTPIFMQYIQYGKKTPSCSIILQEKEYKVIFFEQGDIDDYSNCNNIYPPIITKVNGKFYAAYKYSEEETRGSLIDGYIVISIKNNDFYICRNQENLSSKIKKAKKKTPKTLECVIENDKCL
ncbi:hypothetical protein [Vogesella mureinivorans]|uniref:hypothetical protein n=1 Tax=Vogesella mureinivorans TaxID=657276 RepID=UPI0011CB914D|nr:hypothetical protein [Vogesella mureinivorans]